MRQITLIAVGRLKSRPWKALAEDYAQRIARSVKFNLIELKDHGPEAEGQKMLAHWQKLTSTTTVAVTEEGQSLSSRELSGWLSPEAPDLCFVMGGPYGLCPEVRATAGRQLSLSPMTFTHECARVLLLEQLYRGLSLLQGSGYHHD
jgi:23S rRNA (pseudouridine1915-N3)-methyltransferase